MLFDLQSEKIPTDVDHNFDIVVVGAGAAGITIAKRLEALGNTVALLEGGGTEYTEKSQSCYEGIVTGDPYFDLDVTRLRYFGGSTNHWAGWCRSFEEVDFQRSHLGPEYQWPIEFNDIDRFKEEACSILEIPSEFNDKREGQTNIKSIKFQFSPPVRFIDKYLKELEASPSVSIFLNANLTNFVGTDGVVNSVVARSFNGNILSIKGRKVVLSMGGIENSRFLLWIDQRNRQKFFAKDLPIGRYWMEHPIFTIGSALVDKQKVSNRFYSLTSRSKIDQNILNCHFRIEHFNSHSPTTKGLIKEILCLAPNLGKRLAELADKELICGALLRASWEQAPNRNNAVTLKDDADIFGIPRVNLRWQKTVLDRETINRSVVEFNDWLLEIDGGRIQLDGWMLNDGDYPTNQELAGNHHMGGTRMHGSSAYGVVDSDCKVFGSKNLYIAGSSVFTTGGHNNPTLPIVQLALRLAEHLAS